MPKLCKRTVIISALAVVFLVLELALSLWIQFPTDTPTRYVCYSSVVLAFVFGVTCYKKDYNYLFTVLALAFTVIADYFLVLPESPNQLPGMIFFSVAQLLYAVKLFFSQKDKKARIIHLVVRVALSIIAVTLTVLVLGENADSVGIISMFYYANLVVNIVYAFITKNYLFGVGLCLFACCDAIIGLSVMTEGYLPIPDTSFIHKILHPGFNIVWAFYAPSQTLIALSLVKPKLLNKPIK